MSVSTFPDKSAFSTIPTDLDVEIFKSLPCKDKAALCETATRFTPLCHTDDLKKKCITITLNNQQLTKKAIFSPDGKILAATAKNNIKIWDVKSQKCVETLTVHNDYVSDIAFSPDGKFLVSGGSNFVDINTNYQETPCTIEVWDVDAGKRITTITGHAKNILSVAFSPNGNIIASGNSNDVKLWDVASEKFLKTLTDHDNNKRVAFSPDGRYFAFGSVDDTIKLWDIRKNSVNKTFKINSESKLEIGLLVFSPDSKFIAGSTMEYYGDGSYVFLLDLETGRVSWMINKNGTIEHNSWMSTYHQLDGTIEPSSSVFSVAFSPDGSRLATGSRDKTVKIWNVASKKCVNTLSGHKAWVLSVDFSPDGEHVVSADTSGVIKIWNSEKVLL